MYLETKIRAKSTEQRLGLLAVRPWVMAASRSTSWSAPPASARGRVWGRTGAQPRDMLAVPSLGAQPVTWPTTMLLLAYAATGATHRTGTLPVEGCVWEVMCSPRRRHPFAPAVPQGHRAAGTSPGGVCLPAALVHRGQDPFAGVSRASPWLVHSQTWG